MAPCPETVRVLQVLKGGMDRAERAHALAEFRAGAVRVLVMDSSGAVGLDLSFVAHVFLMEPLGDLSMEQQIISRAHRLGATHAVHAEVLVMKVRAECLVAVHELPVPVLAGFLVPGPGLEDVVYSS